MLNQLEMEKPEDVCVHPFMTFYFLGCLISNSRELMRALKFKRRLISNTACHSAIGCPFKQQHKLELKAHCGSGLLAKQAEMTLQPSEMKSELSVELVLLYLR